MPKKNHPTVYVTVLGGNVQSVFSTDENINVEIIDWDNAQMDEDIEKAAKVMYGKALRGHKVF